MKNIVLLSSLVLSAVLVQPAFAQSNSSEDSASIFLPESNTSVARGMSREAVTFMVGVPSTTIGSDVWVYWNFRGAGTPDATKYDTLVLVFTGDRVGAMRLCDSKPVRELIAKQNSKSGSKTVAAK